MEVYQLTHAQLNIAFEVLQGAKEDRHRKSNVLKGTYSVPPRDYATDPGDSLTIQGVAIAKDAVKYIDNLHYVKFGHHGWEGETEYKQIAAMLNASPQERAMAAHLTLKESL
ncbi:hypothetical protein ABH897_002294 [Paenibacillus sp. RC73]|uniref:hypothetical protein n=1 Tax=Paenibacillus sp. RC73 TaxID=3156250 RepID=UPI003833C6A7